MRLKQKAVEPMKYLYAHELGLISYNLPKYNPQFLGGDIPITGERCRVCEDVSEDAECTEEFGSLKDFITTVEAMALKVPEDFRDTTEIKFSSHGGDDYSSPPTFEIRYWRPETDQEYAWRTDLLAKAKAAKEAALRREAAKQEANERATYEKLKQKFG